MMENSNCTDLKEQILQNDQLPVLPSGVPYLLQALLDENTDNNKLKTVIERFPTIAARLLFLANSAWAAPPNPITTLDMACARLRLNTVRNISIALAISSPFNPARCSTFDAERYWCTALLVADGSGWLASCTQGAEELDVQTAHTAGLLHNLGLLWLADNRPEDTAHALEIAMHKSIPLNQALLQVTGTNYCEVGGYLGEIWALPDILVAAMREHCNHSYDQENWQCTSLIGYAAAMVSAVCDDAQRCPKEPNSKQLHIDPADSEAVFAKIAAKLESTREMARILFLK